MPELAGTWVFNNIIYPLPANHLEKGLDFTSELITGDFHSMNISTTYLQFATQETGTGAYTVYDFRDNSWKYNRPKTVTFPVGETASDTFRAWLASNATKQ